jgi:hypothetical protein
VCGQGGGGRVDETGTGFAHPDKDRGRKARSQEGFCTPGHEHPARFGESRALRNKRGRCTTTRAQPRDTQANAQHPTGVRAIAQVLGLRCRYFVTVGRDPCPRTPSRESFCNDRESIRIEAARGKDVAARGRSSLDGSCKNSFHGGCFPRVTKATTTPCRRVV